MSAQVIAQPSIPLRSRSALIAVAIFTVIVLAVSAGVAALVSDSSSGTSSTAVRPGAITSADSCPGDAGALLAVVATLPVADGTRISHSVSPETMAMFREAARLSALTNSVPVAPDAPVLAGVLSRISPSDSAVIVNALAPQTRATVQAANPRVCG